MSAPSASWSAPRADARTAALAALVGVVLFLASWLVLHVDAIESPFQIVDTRLYQRYGDAIVDEGQVPYRDFGLEYPPGALPAFVLPSLGPADAYRDLFEPIMAVLGAALVAILVAGLARAGASPPRLLAAGVFAGLSPLLLGTVILTRFDLYPAVVLTGALWALCADRSRLGLGLLAAAVSIKLYPLVILPLALLYVFRRQGGRRAAGAAATFGLVLAAIVIPFAIVAPQGVADAIRRQTDRPLQIESTGAAVVHALNGVGLTDPTVESGSGSQNLVGPLPDAIATAATAVQIAAILVVWLLFALRARPLPTPQDLLSASAAAVLAFVAFGKVLSPQFMIWLIALVPLLAGRRNLVAIALGAAAFLLTHAWFPRRYWDLVDLEPGPAWLVVMRDAALVALFAVAVVAMARGPGAPRTG